MRMFDPVLAAAARSHDAVRRSKRLSNRASCLIVMRTLALVTGS